MICDLTRLQSERKNKTVVFANGCFDLFHVGHLALLEFAKTQGEILVVGINSDASVRSNKAENRPIISESERFSIVRALRCVDFAFIFEGEHPGELLEQLRPDIIVKGAEYRTKPIKEQAFIDRCGCKIVWFERIGDTSTTAIVEKMRGK